MTAESEHTLVGPLLAQLSGRFSAAELDQVRDAYEFAARRHEGQRRKSGDQYITHPLAVAEAAAAFRFGAAGPDDDRVMGNAGSVVATVVTLPPVLAAGVKWLRERLGITRRRHHDN
jgi:(p)ppGpp synthase/HD superfamily hydrolase